jgi:hypothetical protein
MHLWLRACIIRRLNHAQITCPCSIHCIVNMHTYCLQIRSQRLASSLLHWIDSDKAGKLIAHISACSQKQQNNTHHLIWNLWRSISFPALQTRSSKDAYIYIYIHIYIYIYPKEKLDVHSRVSTWSYKLGCTHTCMRRVHVRARLNALVWHQRSTGGVRVLPKKKKASQLSPGISACIFCTRPRMQRATHVTTISVPT